MADSGVEVDEIVRVLQSIRGKEYAYIPENLVEDITLNEFYHQDDRKDCRKVTKNILDRYLQDCPLD